MFELGILIISSVTNLLLGYLVYAKNPDSVTNRRFLILTASLVAWSAVNYASVHPVLLAQIVWVRLVLFFASLLCLAVYRTFTVFPDTTARRLSRREWWLTAYTVVVSGLTLTPAVFGRLAYSAAGSANPQVNPGIVLFVVLVACLLGGGIGSLIIKHRRSAGRRRVQLRLVLSGLIVAFGLIVLSNLVLVIGFGVTVLVPLGSAYTLVFSGAFAYAIIKHRLFDIRRAAARGLAYVLTIAFLASAYSLAVFGVSSFIIGSHDVNLNGQTVNIVLGLAMALSFQPIKRFFDRLSNSIFYKDAYDPGRFLDQLNQAMIAEVSVERMLHKCIGIITANLKAAGCAFIIYETDHNPVRVVSSKVGVDLSRSLARLRADGPVLPKGHGAVVTDMLEADGQDIAQQLNELDIAVVIRLLPGGRRRDEGIGKLVLAPKVNGDPYSHEDVQLLEIISKELVIAIENALRFEEIERFNETLQQKVDDATSQLRDANKRLKQLNESKDDFIGMASHQLRTPLSSVKGYVSLVMDGDAGPVTETQRKLLLQAFTSSQKMVYLVADMLNISRLKTGKFIIERAPVNLAKLIADEVAQLREEAAVRSLELTVKTPHSFPLLPLDETKTRQVIMNFLDNAIYYTPAGGHIRAELKELPSSIEFRVIDNGIGVPKAERHHLFNKFYRAKNAQRTRPDGTGLGLYMARKVIIAQGGALIFDSEEGRGSTFGFSFPKDMPTANSTVIAQD